MRRRITARFPLDQGGGLCGWLSNFFGFHKAGDQLIFDEESDASLLDRCILAPDGLIRTILNCVMGVAVIYTCITVPLYIGFDLEESDVGAGIGHLVDAIFFLDILLTFRTAILLDTEHGAGGDGRLNTVPWQIFTAYIRGGLFLDLISTLPFDAMAEASAARLTRVIRLVRLTRLLKLGRVARLSRLLPALNKLIVKHPGEFNVMSTLLQMLFLMHLLACAFVFVLTTVDDDARPWWAAYVYDKHGNLYIPSRFTGVFLPPALVELNGTNATEAMNGATFETELGTKYLAAFYWAASTASTTGVGDIFPDTDAQVKPMKDPSKLLARLSTLFFFAARLQLCGDHRRGCFLFLHPR